MSLKYAILGFLSLHPMSGYDLKRQYFDGSVAHFWPADQTQIYRTLERLHADGWVTMTVEVQTERPSRKVYAITPAGSAALVAWLKESRPLGVERRPFLLQLYFARHLNQAELLDLLQTERQRHLERLQQYQSLPLPDATTEPMVTQLKFGRMTLEFGLAYEQMQLDWFDQLIEEVEAAS